MLPNKRKVNIPSKCYSTKLSATHTSRNFTVNGCTDGYPSTKRHYLLQIRRTRRRPPPLGGVDRKILLDRATLVGYEVVEIAKHLNFGTALANRQLNTPRGVVAYHTVITPLGRASTRTFHLFPASREKTSFRTLSENIAGTSHKADGEGTPFRQHPRVVSDKLC